MSVFKIFRKKISTSIKKYTFLKIKKERKKILKTVIYEQITLSDLLHFFEKNRNNNLALNQLSKLYSPKKNKINLRDFRTVQYVFDKIKLNWIIIYEEYKNKTHLAGHAISCQIKWSGSICDLPKNGWSGATLRSYGIKQKESNTLVGLFIHIQEKYKNNKLSKAFINEMKDLARKKKYKLIIPLRPPTRFKKEFCKISFDDFCKIKTDDGYFKDFWIRQHQKLGGKYLSYCKTSHQHKMSLHYFNQFFGDHKFLNNGYYTVNILGGWYRVFYDIKEDIVTINQGCVWVEHYINKIK